MVASCLDVTYEQLTGDLTKVNFSSIRAGLIEFRRRVAMTQQLIFITQGLGPLAERFKELAGVYLSANSVSNATYKIILPKTEWVDPLKDAQADIAEIRSGLATLEEKLAERGVEDIESHIKQLAKEQGYDIILDSNPVHNTQGQTTVTDPEQEQAAQGDTAQKKPAKAKEKPSTTSTPKG
jgi:capsid protein